MPIFNAEVVVMPQVEVADPQGQAIEEALHRLKVEGLNNVEMEGMRVGKVFHVKVTARNEAAAAKAMESLGNRVLANPNTEEFTFSLEADA